MPKIQFLNIITLWYSAIGIEHCVVCTPPWSWSLPFNTLHFIWSWTHCTPSSLSPLIPLPCPCAPDVIYCYHHPVQHFVASGHWHPVLQYQPHLYAVLFCLDHPVLHFVASRHWHPVLLYHPHPVHPHHIHTVPLAVELIAWSGNGWQIEPDFSTFGWQEKEPDFSTFCW